MYDSFQDHHKYVPPTFSVSVYTSQNTMQNVDYNAYDKYLVQIGMFPTFLRYTTVVNALLFLSQG